MTSLKFGSVCSGVEAASLAFNPLGMKAAWFAEIDSFPCALLEQRFPKVPNLGDMTTLPTRILSGEVEAPDLFCGGTPCQAFSVAGLRRSLDDYRGNLSLVFCEIANAIDTVRTRLRKRPVTIFWENVPGVLNTKDNAFGCFLAGLSGADAPLSPGAGRWPSAGYVAGPKRRVAWRILDAQYFGVPQRRRRVYVVASVASRGIDPTKVLFESQGVYGDSPAGGSAEQDSAAFVESSFGAMRKASVAGTVRATGGTTGGGGETLMLDKVCPTLLANCGAKKFLGNQEVFSGKYFVYEGVRHDARE